MNNLKAQTQFDSIKRIDDDGNEHWFARELQPLLGYDKWQNFQGVIESAIICLNNSNIDVKKHIISASNMVKIGSGAEREIADYSLSRLGAYIVTINGDSRKTEIAQAQAYFAAMTIFAEQTISNSIENVVIDENSAEYQLSQLDDLNDFLVKMESGCNKLTTYTAKDIWAKSVTQVIQKRFGIDIQQPVQVTTINSSNTSVNDIKLRANKGWKPVEFYIPYIIRFCQEKKKPEEELTLTVADMHRCVYQVRNMNTSNKVLLEQVMLECQRLGIIRDTGRLTAKGYKIYLFTGDK